MSSIQSFLKQRNPATSIVQAPDNDCYYIFVAGPGNYVGNYPPGYMQLASVNPALIPQGTLLRIQKSYHTSSTLSAIAFNVDM